MTGLWSVVHERSFEAVTGPKRDKWLVRSTGLIIAMVGVYFLMAGLEGPTRRTRRFGMLFPAGLATADVAWAWPNCRSKAYLADAVVSGLVIAVWAVAKPERQLHHRAELCRLFR